MRSISPGSYWHQTVPDDGPRYQPLAADTRVDVAIIGAGITGLTAAALLKEAGKRVAVLEAGRIGAGTTGGTTAHLTAVIDTGLTTLIKDFGEEGARKIVQSNQAAIDRIERWCGAWGIDCDFRRVPAVFYTEEADGIAPLEEQRDAALRLGLNAADIQGNPLPFPVAGGFRVENQGRFHATRYLRGLAERVHGGNATIHEETRAEPPSGGGPCTVRTNRGTVTADAVIAATHSGYFGISQIDVRVAPYQSYVIAARVEETVPDALLWDDADPYHYTRWASSDDPHLLLVGGADHKTGQGGDERDHFRDLEEYARERFRVTAVEHRWSAELFEPADGVPLIGPMLMQKHVYVASGYSGNGMTFGTVAGELVADQILGRTSPLSDVYSPARFKPLAEGPDLIKENLNVAKRFVADRLGVPKISSPEEVPPGTGRLVEWNGHKVALYRAADGTAHALSPVCTHAGCIVQWNEAEATWDCPCHGGRYEATGERIYGPPPSDLKPVDVSR